MGTPIRAIARVRPLIASDHSTLVSNKTSCSNALTSVVEVATAASQIIIGQDHFCDFDAVFGPDASQKELYAACVEDLVTSFLQGYNVSIIGYGGCGSGKTYTVTGPSFLWAMDEEEFGLLPRAVRHLYRHISECSSVRPGYESHVSVSYLLLSAGSVHDLLTSQPVLTPLPILTDHKGYVMAPGLSSIDCCSISEVFNCLEAGLVARHNHATNAPPSDPNVAGSPPHTHASFTITLQQHLLDKDGKSRFLFSRLNFVDMAGLDQQWPSLQTSMSVSQSAALFAGGSTSSLPHANNTLNGTKNSNTMLSSTAQEGTIGEDVKQMEQSHGEVDEEGGPTVAAVEEQRLLLAETAEEADVAAVPDNSNTSVADGVNMPPDHQCLAAVIASLVDRNASIPYAHSMLTQLLKESFGGNCLTLVVCCASPASSQLPATMLTMKYGGLSRYILNSPLINEVLPPAASQGEMAGDAPQEANDGTGAAQPAAASTEADATVTASSSQTTPSNTGSNNAATVAALQQEEFIRLQQVAWQSSQLIDSADSLLRSALPFLPPMLQAQCASWLCLRADWTAQYHKYPTPSQYYWSAGGGAPATGCATGATQLHHNNSNADHRTLHVIEEVSEPGDVRNSRGSTAVSTPAADEGSLSSLGEEFFEQVAVMTSQFEEHTAVLVRNIEERFDIFTESGASESNASNELSVEECSTDEQEEDSLTEELSVKHDTPPHCHDIMNDNNKSRSSIDSDADMDSCNSDVQTTSEEELAPQRNGRRNSMVPANIPIIDLSDSVSSVALHVQQANRRRQRELRETIIEKESHLQTLQQSAREEQELLKQNEDKLKLFQELIAKEESSINELRGLIKSSKGRREVSLRLLQHERNLQRHKEKSKSISNFMSILQAAQIPAEELSNLTSRLDELRYELQEVETLVRVDDQRKQRLQDLKNNRPRKTSGSIDPQDMEGKSEKDEEELEAALRGGGALLFPECVKKEKKTVNTGGGGGEAEHVLVKRNRPGKAVVSVYGLSQPHKRRLITSSSEQYSSDGEVGGSRDHQQLRIEISNLRDSKELLITCRQRLSRMMRGIKEELRWEADKKLLELDEAVEAVDTSIEYKNELICGRTQELAATSPLLLQGRLLESVLNLSMEEVRTMLVKYFNRVVDIRIEFRKQEVAFSELETKYESKCRHLQKLEWSYQQASLDMERQCAVQQRQYMQILHELFRHIEAQEVMQQRTQAPVDVFTGNTNNALLRDLKEMEKNLFYYKDLSSKLKSFIRHQQQQMQQLGVTYNHLPSPHHLQQENVPPQVSKKEATGDGKPAAELKMKLSCLGPGSTLMQQQGGPVTAQFREDRALQHQPSSVIGSPIESNMAGPVNHTNPFISRAPHPPVGGRDFKKPFYRGMAPDSKQNRDVIIPMGSINNTSR